MTAVIIGSSGSGKSEYAEDLALRVNKGQLIYIATMIPYTKEVLSKIKKHKEMRQSKNFNTVECYINLSNVEIPKQSTVLLECMSNLVANEMFEEAGAKQDTLSSIIQGMKGLAAKADNLIIVTNDVFRDAVEYSKEMDQYLGCLGTINQELSKLGDLVVEVVCGVPIEIKNLEEELVNEIIME